MLSRKTVVIVAGPTAVGKTAAAMHIASRFHTQIISADSRQCYHELNIGVARPSPKELEAVTHHFVGTHSIKETVTAADFEIFALDKVEEIFRENELAVLCGGTGLYIRAFCEGLDAIPEVSPDIRDAVVRSYQEKGLDWLRGEIRQKDPLFFATGETRNPQRMMRALEVVEATGKSILEFRSGNRKERDFRIVKIGLELPRPELNRRIDERVEQMIAAGLVDEVQQLLPYRYVNALQTVGYQEIFAYLDHVITLEEAIKQIKQHTHQYAKRQMTWFRKDTGFRWFHPSDTESMIRYIREPATTPAT